MSLCPLLQLRPPTAAWQWKGSCGGWGLQMDVQVSSWDLQGGPVAGWGASGFPAMRQGTPQV